MYLFPLLYGYRYVKNNGVLMNQRDTLNLIGFNVVDNQAQGQTDVSVSASGTAGITAILGDVRATGPGAVTGTVAGIQTFPVSTTAPSLSTDTLRWQGSWYAPAAESGGGSTPSGTGFPHITGGAQDAAARAVSLATADVTGLLPIASVAPGTAGQIAVTNSTTNASWTSVSGDATLSSLGVVAVGQLSGFSSVVTMPNGTVMKLQGDASGFMAGTGTVRTTPAFSIYGRNTANSLDVLLFQWDGSNNVNIGQTSGIGTMLLLANAMGLYTSGTGYYDAASVIMRGAGHSTTMFQAIEANKSIQLFSASLSFASGQGVLGIADRSVAPTTTPSSGGVLYSEAGALKWKGSSGTVTTLAVA